jgi:serine/threonine-protein kinase RsbW
MIRLSVPGSLLYRELVLRAVESSCKLVRPDSDSDDLQEPSHGAGTRDDQFETQLVSAVGEAFNNIALHAYGAAATGRVEIEITPLSDRLTIVLRDTGKSFDPGSVPPPDLEGLPESGMGLFIIRSFVDLVEYEAGRDGAPNLLRLVKVRRIQPEARSLQGAETSSPRRLR